MVRFCKKVPNFCFVTDLVDDKTKKKTHEEEISVVQDIYLWMKLISTINVSKKNYNYQFQGCQGSYIDMRENFWFVGRRRRKDFMRET